MNLLVQVRQLALGLLVFVVFILPFLLMVLDGDVLLLQLLRQLGLILGEFLVTFPALIQQVG